MPYKNIHWVKLEKRLLEDPRWYMMSEKSQLNYIKIILLCAVLSNKIPKNFSVIKKAFKTEQSEEELQKSFEEIRFHFPKVKENKGFFYIKDFGEHSNWVFPGSSQGTPREVPGRPKNKNKNKIKNKNKDKEGGMGGEKIEDRFPFLKDQFFLQTFQDYLEMRQKIKKPATDRAKELILKKLHQHDIQTAITMLEQSIENSWQGVFPLREEKKKSLDKYANDPVAKEALERLNKLPADTRRHINVDKYIENYRKRRGKK